MKYVVLDRDWIDERVMLHYLVIVGDPDIRLFYDLVQGLEHLLIQHGFPASLGLSRARAAELDGHEF